MTSAAISWLSLHSTQLQVIGAWARQVTDNWFRFWDLAKPVIAQVHGYAIAGATELVQACDLVYVADDARISYPIVRVASPPDCQYHEPLLGMRRAMEIMLTGGEMLGPEAAQIGWANRSFPADILDEEVLDVAGQIAAVATDLAQINKRMVHRQAEIMGVRAAIRAGSEFQALAGHQASVEAFKERSVGFDEAAQRRRCDASRGPRETSLHKVTATESASATGVTIHLSRRRLLVVFFGILLGATLSGL